MWCHIIWYAILSDVLKIKIRLIKAKAKKHTSPAIFAPSKSPHPDLLSDSTDLTTATIPRGKKQQRHDIQARTELVGGGYVRFCCTWNTC